MKTPEKKAKTPSSPPVNVVIGLGDFLDACAILHPEHWPRARVDAAWGRIEAASTRKLSPGAKALLGTRRGATAPPERRRVVEGEVLSQMLPTLDRAVESRTVQGVPVVKMTMKDGHPRGLARSVADDLIEALRRGVSGHPIIPSCGH